MAQENLVQTVTAAAENVAGNVAGKAEVVLGLSDGTRYFLYGGLICYVLIILMIGYFASRKVRGMGDFLVAGRRLPLWMASATLLATWFGAGSSMGVAATVYSDGVGAVINDPFAAALSLILAGVFIVGMLRRMKMLTVTDIIEHRYGKWAGVYASIWMIPVYIGWLGAQILGLGTILHVLTGVDVMWGSLIGAAVILIYTVAGGMWAVTLTDVVQLTLIILGLFMIIPGAVHEAGGIEAVFAKVPAEHLTLLPTESGWDNYIYYIGQWMVMGLGCMVGQDLIQRSLSSRNEKIAISSSVIAGVFYAALALVPITIGFAARVVLEKHGVTTAMMGENLENQVLPRMAIIVLGKLNPIILVLFLSALVSAIMSSADSSLLAASSLLTNNVLRPMMPRISDAVLLPLTRFVTVFLTIVATILTFKVDSIYRLMVNCWASQLVVVFLPVVTALYVRKASRYAAWATMIASTVVWLAYTFVGAVGIDMPFSELLASPEFDHVLTVGAVYGFCAGLVAFLASYLGERLTARAFDHHQEEE